MQAKRTNLWWFKAKKREMEYHVKAKVDHLLEASVEAKESVIQFGISPSQDNLPNPVEILLASFASCCLKNVERFAAIMGFNYTTASIKVSGTRQAKPTKLVAIEYHIEIQSTDPKLNLDLLHKNLQNHGKIYNTLKEILAIEGSLIRLGEEESSPE